MKTRVSILLLLISSLGFSQTIIRSNLTPVTTNSLTIGTSSLYWSSFFTRTATLGSASSLDGIMYFNRAASAYTGTLESNLLTAPKTWNLPNNSGTFLLDNDSTTLKSSILNHDQTVGGSWTFTKRITASGGINTGTDTAYIQNGTILDAVSIRNGANIQSILNSYTQRSVSLNILGTVTQSSPIYFGNSTVFQGGAANLTTQGSQTYYPRGVFDFSGGATDGFVNTDTSWRAQNFQLRDITMKGSGYNNGKSGVHIVFSDSGTPGLGTMKHVYIENFQTGINGGGIINNLDMSDGHIMKFTVAMDSIYQSNSINHNDIWLAQGNGNTVGMRIIGYLNDITRNYFELGNNSAADTLNTGIVFSPASYTNVFGFNKYAGAASIYVVDSGKSNIFAGNAMGTFNQPLGSVGRFAGSGGAYFGNTFNPSGPKTTGDAILISGNSYSFFGNSINQYTTPNKSIYRISGNNNNLFGNTFINSSPTGADITVTGSDNILSGYFPEGIVDAGTRTIINGRSKNAGNPASGGVWNGHAKDAWKAGVVIEDTTVNPSTFYRADIDTNWTDVTGHWIRTNGILWPSVANDTIGIIRTNGGITAINTGLTSYFLNFKNKDNTSRLLVDTSNNWTFSGSSPLWTVTSTNNASGFRINVGTTATVGVRLQYNGSTMLQSGVTSSAAAQSFGTFTIKPSPSTPTLNLLSAEASSSTNGVHSDSLGNFTATGLGTFNGGVSARLLSTIDTVKTKRIVLTPDLTSGAIEMGRIRWDSTQRAFYGTQYLVERSFQMNHNIHTDSLFISGTSSETNVDTVIMGANYPVAGKIVETKLFGKYNATGGGSKTFVFRIRLAGVMIDSVMITTPSGGSVSEPVEVLHQLGFRSAGASGICYSILKTTSEVGVKMNAMTHYAVNTTSQNLFILSVQISDATAGNNFQRETTYTSTVN